MSLSDPNDMGPAEAWPAGAPEYSEDGVDLTLIRWMLSLTPAERLQTLQDTVNSIMRLRDGGTED